MSNLAPFARGSGIGALHGEIRLEESTDLDTSSYDYVTAVFVGKGLTNAAIYPIGTDGDAIPIPLPVTVGEKAPEGVILQVVTTGLKGVRVHVDGEIDYIDVFAGVTGLDF